MTVRNFIHKFREADAPLKLALQRGIEELNQTVNIETYKVGLEAATELVPDLPGRVILTADHGTCLSCGQLFHGRHLDKHDHLTVVPWMEVSQTR